MKRSRFLMALVLAAAAGTTAAADRAGGSTEAATVASGTNTQVIVYYFHGTVRCVECLKIEKQAKNLIEAEYKAEMATKRLVFKAVNYEQPENVHFLQDYQLPCPSLVVVRQTGGKDMRWKLLGESWQHAENPEKFNAYVKKEVGMMLAEGK